MPLKVHFLNVGRGDCTVIEFPSGRIGIVDIDTLRTFDPDTERELREQCADSFEYIVTNALTPVTASDVLAKYVREREVEITDPFRYYDEHIGRVTPFRVLITHPDMDHMTGLDHLYRTHGIANFWHTGIHDFNLADTTDAEWRDCPYAKSDWDMYNTLRAGGANLPTTLQKYQGLTGDYWTQDGLELWAPTPQLEARAVEISQPNVLSMIIRVSHAGRAIVLGGDAIGDETWAAIYPTLKMSGVSVLKASHHGRKTGYHQPSVREMAPRLTITSVGQKEHDATELYRRYSEHTVSLRDAGDITITINDDGQWYYSPNAAAHWKDKLVT